MSQRSSSKYFAIMPPVGQVRSVPSTTIKRLRGAANRQGGASLDPERMREFKPSGTARHCDFFATGATHHDR
jgi:hypothetical protein